MDSTHEKAFQILPLEELVATEEARNDNDEEHIKLKRQDSESSWDSDDIATPKISVMDDMGLTSHAHEEKKEHMISRLTAIDDLYTSHTFRPREIVAP